MYAQNFVVGIFFLLHLVYIHMGLQYSFTTDALFSPSAAEHAATGVAHTSTPPIKMCIKYYLIEDAGNVVLP